MCARAPKANYLGSYSDNIGILAPDEETASAIVVAVRDVLERHPAGPFHIGKWSRRRAVSGFSFLGYRFGRSKKGVIAYPRRGALERFFYKHSHHILEAMQGDFAKEFPRLTGEVKHFAGCFPHWTRRARWQARGEERLFGFLVAHCRTHGLSPYSVVREQDWPKVEAAEEREDRPATPFRWTAPAYDPNQPPRGIPVPTAERLRMASHA